MMSFFGKNAQSKNLQIRQLLKDNLNFAGFYWYPLHAEPKAQVMEYFETDRFVDDFGIDRLIMLLKNEGYSYLWEVTELGEDRQVNVEDLDEYSGVESIYCDADAKWAIYFSHENTVTFAGKMIVSAVKGKWANWNEYKDPWK